MPKRKMERDYDDEIDEPPRKRRKIDFDEDTADRNELLNMYFPKAPLWTFKKNMSNNVNNTLNENPVDDAPVVDAPRIDAPIVDAPKVNVTTDITSTDFKLEEKGIRIFASSSATETSYNIKLNDTWKDLHFKDIHERLQNMFERVLKKTTQDYKITDKIKFTFTHPDLENPLTLPPKPIENMNGNYILDKIEKVLTSNEDLTINDKMQMIIGLVKMPNGSGGPRRRITNIERDSKLKKSIVRIENNDNTCAARAVAVCYTKMCIVEKEEFENATRHLNQLSNVKKVLATGKATQAIYDNVRKPDKPSKRMYTQKVIAEALCEKAEIPTDRSVGVDELSKFEDVLNVNICVISAETGNKFIRRASHANRQNIYLYLHDGHFDAISSISGFFSSCYFCEHCLQPYEHKERHSCEACCTVCLSNNCVAAQYIECPDCLQLCRSEECLQRHKVAKFKESTLCESFFHCQQCSKVLSRNRKDKHQCGEYLCKNCDKYVVGEHLCYIRTVKPEASKPNFIFYDFETTQDTLMECLDGYKPTNANGCTNCSVDNICNTCFKCRNCNDITCGRYQHVPNLVITHIVCEHCYNSNSETCVECGSRCPTCNNKSCEICLNSKQVMFKTAEEFFTWLLKDQYAGFTCIAHNAKAFDNYFLLEHLAKQGIQPQKPIFNGTKLMYVEVGKGLNIRFLDSYNFLSMKLAALPKAFGLQELKKGYFPHLFNTKENQDYVGPYPKPEYYGLNTLMKDERKKFLEWYETVKGKEFNFQKEFIQYCNSDVDILKKACLKYRDLMIETCDVDPFQSITTASVAMNVFKTKFLEETWHVVMKDGRCGKAIYKNGKWKWNDEEIKCDDIIYKEFISSPLGQIPPNGYTTNVTYSKESIQWLEWEAHTGKIEIQHGLNGKGEKKIGKYYVDGYCEETKTVYEYHGCFWHGCPICYFKYRTKIKNVRTNQSMEELYTLTKNKEAYLKACGYSVIAKWSHEFENDVKTNKELRKFTDSLDIVDRLDPRDSFFGGRTNALKLHHVATENEKIGYVDFCSLYPYVQKYKPYGIGHPQVITRDFKPLKEYFGIAKIKILPPHQLYLPVLPYKCHGKLKFPLCRTCVENECKEPCMCTNEERMLVGTWCIPEILKAMEKGYVLQKVYEVYHFEKTSTELFSEYVNTFLKFKQESSDWPDWCKMKDEEVNMNKQQEINQKRQEYITEYYENEGVKLDGNKISKNPGLRSVSKILLNSFWGKFGQRLNFEQTAYFNSTQLNEFYQLFSDPAIEVKDFHIINENLILVQYCYSRYQVPLENVTNIFIATFTTCWARLHLYEEMDKLQERVLYHDTDYIIYIHNEKKENPVLGNYLGQLTDELNGEHIVEFLSAGPKNYGYRTNTGNECCKVRGFRLNFTNSQRVNFETLKHIVTTDRTEKIKTTNNKISRNKFNCTLFNRTETKIYKLVYDKRVLNINTMHTYPYGY